MRRQQLTKGTLPFVPCHVCCPLYAANGVKERLEYSGGRKSADYQDLHKFSSSCSATFSFPFSTILKFLSDFLICCILQGAWYKPTTRQTKAARNKYLPHSSDFHDLHSDFWPSFPLMKKTHEFLLKIMLIYEYQSFIDLALLQGTEL